MHDTTDVALQARDDYLVCGSADVSVDIIGLNVERWCDPKKSIAYDALKQWLGDKKYPAAFIFTEMGCSKTHYGGTRDWAQIPGFFKNFPSFDGFSAYAYWNKGAQDFNMFNDGTATGEEFEDG